MAIPTRRQVLKRDRIRKSLKENNSKEGEEIITEEEHKARLENLKALGLIK